MTFFRFEFAAAAMIFLPVAIEPVKAIFRIFMWLAIRLPVVGPIPVTTLRTPGGKPASLNSAATFRAPSGDFSLDLIITQFPVAKAGAVFMANMIKETFQGKMPATTPNGCFKVNVIIPGVLRLD